MLDTSFSSMTELRDYTGLRVLGSVTDTRIKGSARFSDAVVLAAGFAGLAGTLGMLLFIERQYGLETVVVANFGPDVIGRGTGFIVDKRSEEHTSELQSLMRISYAVSCLKKNKNLDTQLQDMGFNVRVKEIN